MKKACILLCLCILISSGILYFMLPQTIPIHIGVSGVDSYGNKTSIFIFPLLSLLITSILLLTRKIDPQKRNYKKFEKPFYAVIFTINLVLFSVMGLLVSESFWPGRMNVSMFLYILIGTMFAIIGNLLPKFKANYMMGIRTPWTLSSEEVWYRTHRFGGKIWFAGGLLMIASGILFMAGGNRGDNLFFTIFVVYILILAFIPCIYSYICYKKIEKRKKERNIKHD